MRKKHPSDGWVPGRFAADEKLYRKLDELRTKIQELENVKKELLDSPPDEAENLAKGTEIYSQPCKFWVDEIAESIEIEIVASWDKIFSYAGTAMIGECTEQEFRRKVQLVYFHSVPAQYKEDISFEQIVIYDVVFDTIKIQLQALGLITHGVKKRTVSDKNTYWKLTPYGEKYLLKVRAIKTKDEDLPF